MRLVRIMGCFNDSGRLFEIAALCRIAAPRHRCGEPSSALPGIRKVSPAAGGTPEWTFPPPYTPKRLKLNFALTFNAAEAPVIAAAAGAGEEKCRGRYERANLSRRSSLLRSSMSTTSLTC